MPCDILSWLVVIDLREGLTREKKSLRRVALLLALLSLLGTLMAGVGKTVAMSVSLSFDGVH